jgi:hypothetical protein
MYRNVTAGTHTLWLFCPSSSSQYGNLNESSFGGVTVTPAIYPSEEHPSEEHPIGPER